MNVREFSEELLKSDPKNNAARLSLYNFLVTFVDPHQPVNEDLFFLFSKSALQFSSWKEQVPLLDEELKLWKERFRLNFPLPSELQVIEVKSIVDLYEIVRLQEKKLEGSVRVLPDSEKGLVSIRMMPNDQLRIRYYDRFVVIHKGQLEPLNNFREVVYGRDLEPARGFTHILEIQPNSWCLFQVNQDGLVDGVFVKGRGFQSIEPFHNQKLTTIPALFYPLKRLERFFINRNSDPFYQELIQLLQRALDLIRDNPSSEAWHLATAALERGANAQRFIFIDDKTISYLLEELSSALKMSTQNYEEYKELNI